jgi:hypothetical protein
MAAYKTKPFPAPLDAAWLSGVTQSCAFILALNWCSQGMRGMDRKELGFRLLLEALLAGGIGWLLVGLLERSVLQAAGIALPMAHSVGFTLNGQFWTCARYCRWYQREPAALAAHVAEIAARLERRAWLDEAALIGSQARQPGTFGPRSDIDLRLIVPAGMMNWLRCNLLLLRLRAEAFVRRIPLDLYAYDDPASLQRFDQQEPLRLLLERRGRLRAAFPARVVGTA